MPIKESLFYSEKIIHSISLLWQHSIFKGSVGHSWKKKNTSSKSYTPGDVLVSSVDHNTKD